MDSLSSLPTLLLASIAMVSFIALINQKPVLNSLLLLTESILIAIYYWTRIDQYYAIKTVSLILILLFLVIWTANIYLEKTTQLVKSSPSTLAVLMGAGLFVFFAFTAHRLKGSELTTTYEYVPFINDNMLEMFVVIFTMLSMLISANAILSTKNND